MKKIYGSPVRQDGLYKIGRDKWELVYGFGKDLESDETGWNWRERFDHRPTEEEIRSAIVGAINEATDEAILTGMVWKGQRVWLSTETQINLNRAYNLCREGSQVPLRLKVWEGPGGEAEYLVFDDSGELEAFVKAMHRHIMGCVSAGYREKDSVDYTVFI